MKYSPALTNSHIFCINILNSTLIVKASLATFMLLFNITIYASNGLPDKLTQLPLLTIVTTDNVMPTYEIVNSPEGCAGTSIRNNNYVTGKMLMTLGKDTLYDSGEYKTGLSGMRIKVRGNSTAAFLAQHPYKIKLSKKADLLMRGDNKFRHKEWVLLSMYTWHPLLSGAETNTLTLFGTELSRAIGISWEPQIEFVNVVINEKYQGMYYLIESVSKGESRIQVENNGFIIENDAFWWNEDGHYFKTSHLNPIMGYTYKYPDKDDVTESIEGAIKDYMERIETKLWNQEDMSELIDYDSFARWIVAHDILGTDDVVGSNTFLYRQSSNDASKLQMGPLWDFDSSFRTPMSKWSPKHTSDIFYYPQLFKQSTFVKKYTEVYKAVRPHILQHLTDYCKHIENRYGATFDENMKLHQTLYPGEGRNTLHDQLNELLRNLETRLNELDILVEKELCHTGIIKTTGNDATLTRRFGIDGADCSHVPVYDLRPGIYIDHYSDGTVYKWIKRR